jgi:curved DNA-binding protein CbpA
MLLKKLAPCSTNVFIKAKYATIASAHDHWHRLTNSNRPPTPYQILNIDPSAPYTKTQFTELVKIYHPDRCDHPSGHGSAHLPPEVRLERYRLIVAAHSILSDPVKRKAYDSYGAGWAGAVSFGEPGNRFTRSGSPPEKYGPFTPHDNATWEDWEQWRWKQEERARSGESQQPRFVANGTFASGIIAVMLLGAFIQQTHLETVSTTRQTLLNGRSSEAEMYIQRKKEEARRRTKSGRIEEFMKQRDPTVLNHPGLARAVTDPDLCASFGVAKMDKEMDMIKKFK